MLAPFQSDALENCCGDEGDIGGDGRRLLFDDSSENDATHSFSDKKSESRGIDGAHFAARHRFVEEAREALEVAEVARMRLGALSCTRIAVGHRQMNPEEFVILVEE